MQQIIKMCSLALIGGQTELHYFSLSEQPEVGHVYATTLPLENTSAGLATKFRWPVFISKLGKRWELRWHVSEAHSEDRQSKRIALNMAWTAVSPMPDELTGYYNHGPGATHKSDQRADCSILCHAEA